MADFMILTVVAVVLAAASWYIIKEKKKGVKCIGCPVAGECSKRQEKGVKCSYNGETKKK